MDYATAKETEMRKAGRIWKHGYQKEEREKERKEGKWDLYLGVYLGPIEQVQ